MSDDLWLKELAQVNMDREAQERSRLDERWDLLSAGELSPEEEAELRALAETSGEAGDAYEAFRPLGPDFQASVVQAIRKQGLTLAAEPEVTKSPAKLLPFRLSTSQTFRWAGWSAVAAVAAALLVLVLRPPVPLPVYSSLKIHGDQEFRGGESAPEDAVVLTPGGRFQGTLQLAIPSRAKDLEDRYFLLRGQDLRPLEVRSQIDPGGAVKIEKGVVSRDLSPGAWTLWVVVGRRGKLPDPADLRGFSTQAQVRQKDWVAVPAEVKIQSRGLPP